MAKKKAEEIQKGLNLILDTAKKSSEKNQKDKEAADIAKKDKEAGNQKEIGKKTVSIEQKPEDFPPFVKANLGLDPNSTPEVSEAITKDEYHNEVSNMTDDEFDTFLDFMEHSKYKFKYVKSKTK